MSLLGSKWMIILLGLTIIVIILYLTGRKSAHAEILIDAPVSAVWQVLTDTEQIKDWNSVLIPVKGKLEEGAAITYEFYQDPENKAEMSATVVKLIDSQLINQKGGMTGVLTFNHKYLLEPVGKQTRVIIHEEYRGIGVNFWNPAAVEKAYEKLSKELNARVMEMK